MIGWVGTCSKTRQAGKIKRHLDAGGVFDVAHLHARAMDSKLVCCRVGQLLGGVVGVVFARHGVVGAHDRKRFYPCRT